MRISDWSSDVCSSDLRDPLVGIIRGDFFQHGAELLARPAPFGPEIENDEAGHRRFDDVAAEGFDSFLFSGIQTERGHANMLLFQFAVASAPAEWTPLPLMWDLRAIRSEEHTSELQSLMRISYAGLCLK